MVIGLSVSKKYVLVPEKSKDVLTLIRWEGKSPIVATLVLSSEMQRQELVRVPLDVQAPRNRGDNVVLDFA